MLKSIQNSLQIIKYNPVLILFLIIYLIFLTIFLQNLAGLQNSPLFTFSLLLILFFNAAFFSGWFAMIKKAVLNLKKWQKNNFENESERIEDILSLKKEFFGAIPSYILSILTVFVLYYVLFVIWMYLNIKFANHFIGSIDFLFADAKILTQNPEYTMQYLANLSEEKLLIIYGWQFLFMGAIALFGVFTIFIPPALFFEKNNSKNPLRAFLDSFLTIFKRPFGVIGINLFIAILTFLLMLVVNFFAQNSILYFIYMVFGIYAFGYIVILLFAYYEESFCKNCEEIKSEEIEEKEIEEKTKE